MSDIHHINEVDTITNPVTVTGTVTVDTSALAKETGGNLDAIKAKTDNIDVALSTRLKPADTLAGVTAVGSITNPVAVTNANLDAAISTRLKPADTLAGVTTVGSITNPVAITNANLDAKLSDIKAKTDNLDATISSLVTAVNTLLKPTNTLTKVTTVDTITNGITVNNGAGVKIYDEGSATYKGLTFHGESAAVCAKDYLIGIAEGDVSGHSSLLKMGINPDIDNTEEDVWEVGGSYVYPGSAMQMEVISSSVNDAGAGTGIQKIRVYYLDNTFAEKSEEVTLNGTTAVATVATDIYRVQYLEATQVGSGGKAAGDIDIRHVTDSPIYGRISTGYTMSRQLIYTVPVNKTLYITEFNLSSMSSGSYGTRLTLRATYSHKASATRTFFLPHGEIGIQNTAYHWKFSMPEHFPAGVDIKLSGISTNAAASCYVIAGLRGWLE